MKEIVQTYIFEENEEDSALFSFDDSNSAGIYKDLVIRVSDLI